MPLNQTLLVNPSESFELLPGSMNEFYFLSLLQSCPDNDTHRLVYADWLDEHADARADFVRLEVMFEENCRLSQASKLADQLAKVAVAIGQPSWQRVIVAERAAELFLHFRQGKWGKKTKVATPARSQRQLLEL